MGIEVANKLRLPLDIIVVEKITHPDYHGYVVCAVSEEGDLSCGESEKLSLVLDLERLNQEIKKAQVKALKRKYLYLKDKKHLSVEGKTVIIIDDGIVTGLTMLAAIHFIKKNNPKEIIVAAPIAPYNIIQKIKKEVNKVIIIEDSKSYQGTYYKDFPELGDLDVVALLRKGKMRT